MITSCSAHRCAMIGDFPDDDSIDIDRVLRGDRQTDRPKPRTITEVVSLRPKLNGGPEAIAQNPRIAGFPGHNCDRNHQADLRQHPHCNRQA